MVILESAEENIMVLGPTSSDRIPWIFTLVPTFILGFFGTRGLTVRTIEIAILMLLFSFTIGIYSLSKLIVHGKKIIIDKSTQTIMFKNRHFFIPTSRTFPFREIKNILIACVYSGDPPTPTWKVFICTSSRDYKVDASSVEYEIRKLANTISLFLKVALAEDVGSIYFYK